jgi:hypothetical protein
MTTPQPSPPTSEILWKQYELHVGLYKEYLNLLLKFNVFYYAATGALLSYYLSHSSIYTVDEILARVSDFNEFGIREPVHLRSLANTCRSRGIV